MSAIVVHRVPFVKLVSLSHSHCEEAQKKRASFAQSKALDSFSTFSLAVSRFTSLFALVDYPFRLLFSITFDLTRRFCAGKKATIEVAKIPWISISIHFQCCSEHCCCHVSNILFHYLLLSHYFERHCCRYAMMLPLLIHEMILDDSKKKKNVLLLPHLTINIFAQNLNNHTYTCTTRFLFLHIQFCHLNDVRWKANVKNDGKLYWRRC